MSPEDHWAKALRMERSRLAKLDLAEDCELVVWSCMQGGAHLLNAMLHHAGLSTPDMDYIRSDKLEPGLAIPEPVERLVALLRSIEGLGPRFVRGPERPQSSTTTACVDAYDQAKTLARHFLDEPRP